MEQKTIYTLGHSTRSFEEIVDLLQEHNVARLADVRRYPRSRRHPHVSIGALETSLLADGLMYIHLPELGGHRKPRVDSLNGAWENEAFRGYADHMASPEFHAG